MIIIFSIIIVIIIMIIIAVIKFILIILIITINITEKSPQKWMLSLFPLPLNPLRRAVGD